MNRRRSGVAPSFLVCLSLVALTSSFAQLKTQRRITGLQLGAAAEGSRVTVVSDSALNDYEAFRRSDRFYVKIPLADFMSAPPRFRADGFENVKVQKAGDSTIVSFKLQPGATARINQYGNRLDVVFSAPNKSFQDNPPGSRLNSATTDNSGRHGTASQVLSNRGHAAGAIPPGSSVSHEGMAADARMDQSRINVNQSSLNNREVKAVGDWNSRTAAPNATASPGSSPLTTFSPAPLTNYAPLTTATPVSSNSIAVSAGSESSNWSKRAAVIRWMSANRLATLVGALILLSLILYLITTIRRRKKNAVQAMAAKAKVQPKYSLNEKLEELSGASGSEQLSRQNAAVEPPSSSIPAAGALTQDHPWVLTKPAINSPTANAGQHSSDLEEREVIEL
ncbi:MAG TPA: hypothetical protein VMZ30_04745 [Pyrinomonadaceae bacterium]|nr:hypothetical protein [Pyrinomonadaceae bacterium]